MTTPVPRILGWLAAALLGLGAAASPAWSAQPGVVTGTVDRPALVKAVTAVDRGTDKKFPGMIDAKTGRFRVAGLPVGATYDCIIDLAGARLEGVNLTVPHSDYEEEQPLSKADVKTITATTQSLNQFEDKVDVLTVTGNIQHAAVLVNKLRTTPFINSKPGEVVWRLELWHYERPEETWVKVQDELFLVLYRERLQKTAYAKKSLTLDPALGGLRLTGKHSAVDVGRVRLPSDKPGVRLRVQPRGS